MFHPMLTRGGRQVSVAAIIQTTAGSIILPPCRQAPSDNPILNAIVKIFLIQDLYICKGKR
jgi:hypothetical protein